MDFINNTPIAAELVVSEIPNAPNRFGMVTAKATYRLAPDGSTALDTEDPVALLPSDEETDLGLLPRDNLPRMDTAFEVILLGQAHAPNGKPVRQMRVGLSVGAERRELMVFGDRIWLGSNQDRTISDPQPFMKMPLTDRQAFGGTCEVLIDKDAPVDVADPRNRLGRGFDPGPSARGLAKMLKAPQGYPLYDPMRVLPNVEDPRQMITRWEDAPAPAYWATVPLDSGLHALRAVKVRDPNAPALEAAEFTDRTYHRAHPDWVIERPPAGANVTLNGLTESGLVSFSLPALRVLGDYVTGSESGTHELVPQMLVLLPEEMRFYLVFRRIFPVPFREGEERSMRLRSEEGWYEPQGGEV